MQGSLEGVLSTKFNQILGDQLEHSCYQGQELGRQARRWNILTRV